MHGAHPLWYDSKPNIHLGEQRAVIWNNYLTISFVKWLYRHIQNNSSSYLNVIFCLKINLCVFYQSGFCGTVFKLGDNCIQNFHLVRYIAGYTVANFWRYPIRRRVTNSCALKCVHMRWLRQNISWVEWQTDKCFTAKFTGNELWLAIMINAYDWKKTVCEHFVASTAPQHT